MKVEAQYPAAAGLGNDAKRNARPDRDDRTVLAPRLLHTVSRPQAANRSSRPSFVPPSLRCGAAFSSRVLRSSKSEGGTLTMADRPGRATVSERQPSTSYWAFIGSLRDRRSPLRFSIAS
jgi:hypothetical protein